jgi:hypothetical protein
MKVLLKGIIGYLVEVIAKEFGTGGFDGGLCL